VFLALIMSIVILRVHHVIEDAVHREMYVFTNPVHLTCRVPLVEPRHLMYEPKIRRKISKVLLVGVQRVK
jgi:hypothetical protein